MVSLHLGAQNRSTSIAGRGLPSQSVMADEVPQGKTLPAESFEKSRPLQTEWKPSGKPTSEPSGNILKSLRKSCVRFALQVAMTASSVGPMFSTFSSQARQAPPESQKELFVPSQEGHESRDSLAYHVTAEDFVAQPIDTVKQKSVKPLLIQSSDSTDVGDTDQKSTLLGYEWDTKFARVSASPSYKDGQLKSKVKASAVSFTAKKEWTKENGTQVRRGFSTRLRYEGEATYSGDQGFAFESKHLDTEFGLEQRYDKTLPNQVQFYHRYFVGARHRYRFGEQEGSEVRALVQTEQKAYKNNAIHMFGQDFGWEASSRQTFVTNWGAVDNNGPQGSIEVEGLLTKTVNVKLLGKEREVRLKAGPELKYSTQDGFSVRPEFGVKVRL